MIRSEWSRAACLMAAAACLAHAGEARAQGAGSTGAEVLHLLAGGRAAALSGAYVGATADADVLFYNPAGIAGLAAGAAVSYQRHLDDMGLATGAGAFRVGRFVLGAAAIFLDYGDFKEIVPDPDFGGQTGMPTGRTLSASEIAARFAGALPVMDGRLNLGLSVGWVATDLAGIGRGGAFLDLGAQYLLSSITVGAALRNLGGAISGQGLADAPLPSEARLGAMIRHVRANGMGAVASADIVAEINGGTTGLVAGVEAGLLPRADTRFGAVGRLGYNAGTGDDGQGNLLIGGGITLGAVAVDYAWQNWERFGQLHRVGVRWTVLH